MTEHNLLLMRKLGNNTKIPLLDSSVIIVFFKRSGFRIILLHKGQ